MKLVIVAACMALTACTIGPLGKATAVNESECTVACSAQFERCPAMFSAFPERGAIECPGARQQCLHACVRLPVAVAPRAMPQVVPTPVAREPPVATQQTSKEARLRELKHFHDEELITDDVYRERQTAVISEP